MSDTTTERPTLADITKWPATVDVRETAAALGCGASTLYDAIKTGCAPVRTVKVAGRIRVVTASLIELLEGA